MRMIIEIEDELMQAALRETGLASKRAVVEAGLRLLVQRAPRNRLLAAFGKYPWDGDLSAQRRSWGCH